LDKHCSAIAKDIMKLSTDSELPQDLVVSLENWNSAAVEYVVRCKQAVKDGLKYLIHAVSTIFLNSFVS